MIIVRVILLYVILGVVLPGMNLSLSAAATLTQREQGFSVVRVIRYISSLAGFEGQTCYGLVLEDDNGVPKKVRALNDQNPQLCHAAESSYSQPELLRWAFEAAEAAALLDEEHAANGELFELLPSDRLAEVVLPPVSISSVELDKLERMVIGAGINYAEHRDEVNVDTTGELLLFPKPVVPTGAYGSVHTGMQIGEVPAQPVLLLDYEVELGLVLLEDLDLRQLPPSYDAFIDKVAFFVANDVSNRVPIILDEENGYTRGKTYPGYLPIGPWIVHGRQLQPRTVNEGEHNLQIGLEVYERVASPGYSENRQLADTSAMLHGPWGIVRYISEMLEQGEVVCMRDAFGKPRYLHNADDVIPAGSLILTGTPGGTAIREPGLMYKAELFLRGGFSLDGARQVFVEDSEEQIDEAAYLQDGDRVGGWIEHLGRQRWSVAVDVDGEPYGELDTGACEPGSQPQSVLSQ